MYRNKGLTWQRNENVSPVLQARNGERAADPCGTKERPERKDSKRESSSLFSAVSGDLVKPFWNFKVNNTHLNCVDVCRCMKKM